VPSIPTSASTCSTKRNATNTWPNIGHTTTYTRFTNEQYSAK